MNQNQSNIKQTNIEENIMDVKSLTKALINFAWFDSISSITWNHEIYLSLLKIEKMVENSENACQKEKKNGSKRFVEIWILCLDIWGWNLKIGNYSGEKKFWRLESKLVRSQREEKKNQVRKKMCIKVVNTRVRSRVGTVTALDSWLHFVLFRAPIKNFEPPSKHFSLTSFSMPKEIVVVIEVDERVEETAQRLLLL